MALKKKKKHEIKGAASWLVTMGDMNNLLMCFFIVMMGDITAVTVEEFNLTLSSFKGALGIFQGGKTMTRGRMSEMGHNIAALPSTEKKTAFNKMTKAIIEALRADIVSLKVRVSEDERGLVVSLPSDVFFDPGSADLTPDARPVLKKVGKIFPQVKNFVRIEGHTDNTGVTAANLRRGFKTNWELSSARSVNVLRYFIEDEGTTPAQLSAVAFGQYRPIGDNNTPEGRSLNRRVDIVILREKMLEQGKHPEIPRPLPDEEWR
jgi:chemotaxis protein MotB